MRRVLKIAGLVLVLAVGALAIFVATYAPKSRAASNEVIEPTPARVERGRYLVESVLGCMDCHAKHDLSRFGGPMVGPNGGGDTCLGSEAGMPGRVCVPNITPDKETGLGGWTDGEILRALREGIDREGRGLFPMMPYTVYRLLSDEDARAVVVYLRTLPPAHNPLPDSEIDFPVSFFAKLAPRPLDGPVAEPDKKDRATYGKYLAHVSGCHFCHTPIDGKHQPLPGMDFAGGHEFKGPWGVVRSANITKHETGLGARDEKAFVGMFKAFAGPASDLPQVPISQATTMPWLTRAHMTEEDLGAIYAHLASVPPVANAVERRPRPALPGRAADAAVDTR